MNIKIVELEKNLPDETVTAIHWYALLQDGIYAVGDHGVVSLVRDDNSAKFIEYKDLTEAKVIEWLKAKWESPEDKLKAEIAELKVPTKSLDAGEKLPWGERL